MLRKFYGLRRTMVQFQMSQFSGNQRNQDGMNKGVTDQLKDKAQGAWDKNATEGWRAGENRAGQSSSSTTVDRREEGQDQGFSMRQQDKDLASGSQGISGGKYGASNMDKSSSGAGMTFSSTQSGGGGEGGAGVSSVKQEPQMKHRLSSEDHSQDSGKQTFGAASSSGFSSGQSNYTERSSDFNQQRGSSDNIRENFNQRQGFSMQDQADRSQYSRSQQSDQQQQRQDKDMSSNLGRQGQNEGYNYNQRMQQEKEYNDFMPHLNQTRDDKSFKMQQSYNQRSEQLNGQFDRRQYIDQNSQQMDQNSMGQQVIEKVQNIAGKVGEQLKGGFQNITEKVKETIGSESDKNKKQ